MMIKWRYRDQINFSKSSQLGSGEIGFEQVVQPQSCALFYTESCYTTHYLKSLSEIEFKASFVEFCTDLNCTIKPDSFMVGIFSSHSKRYKIAKF